MFFGGNSMKLLKKSLFIGSASIALLGGFVWVNQQGAMKQEEPVTEDTTKEEESVPRGHKWCAAPGRWERIIFW